MLDSIYPRQCLPIEHDDEEKEDKRVHVGYVICADWSPEILAYMIWTVDEWVGCGGLRHKAASHRLGPGSLRGTVDIT